LFIAEADVDAAFCTSRRELARTGVDVDVGIARHLVAAFLDPPVRPARQHAIRGAFHGTSEKGPW